MVRFTDTALRLMAALVFLAVSGGGGFAQATEAMLDRSVETIRGYYALHGPARLVQAQLVLRETQYYNGPLDGQWGPGTEAAFRSVVSTRIAIGGPQFGMATTPDDVPAVTDWAATLILHQGGYGDLPD